MNKCYRQPVTSQLRASLEVWQASIVRRQYFQTTYMENLGFKKSFISIIDSYLVGSSTEYGVIFMICFFVRKHNAYKRDIVKLSGPNCAFNQIYYLAGALAQVCIFISFNIYFFHILGEKDRKCPVLTLSLNLHIQR